MPFRIHLNTSLIVGGALLFGLGILIGWFIPNPQSLSVVPVRSAGIGFSFINPLLYNNLPENSSFPRYWNLENALQADVSSVEAQKEASNVAVYFQDMNTSNWVGVNVTQKYDPASMLKVATLIAVLRTSESNPNFLQQSVSVPASGQITNGSQEAYFPAENPVEGGQSYTVEQLMDHMITQSDDGADAVLVNLLGNNILSTVFTDLQIPLPGSTTGVSPQEYSHLFRVLYNSTYLTSGDSELALNLLSLTTFTSGLVAGVPRGTLVSHKFGESLFPPIADNTTWPQTSETNNDIPGLSDCGIIYYPNHPYFLCVMTQGSNFNTLAGVISDISKTTWDQVAQVFPG